MGDFSGALVVGRPGTPASGASPGRHIYVSDMADSFDHQRKRRGVDPVTTERSYSAEEVCFMMAMEEFKARTGERFPTMADAFEVAWCMGYRLVADPEPLVHSPRKFT